MSAMKMKKAAAAAEKIAQDLYEIHNMRVTHGEYFDEVFRRALDAADMMSPDSAMVDARRAAGRVYAGDIPPGLYDAIIAADFYNDAARRLESVNRMIKRGREFRRDLEDADSFIFNPWAR